MNAICLTVAPSRAAAPLANPSTVGLIALEFAGACLAIALLIALYQLPRWFRRKRSGDLALEPVEIDELLMANSPHLVLDLRPPKALLTPRSHIHGALAMPLEQLPGRLQEIHSYRSKVVVVVAPHDADAYKAARILKDNGFTWVHILAGGLTAWKKQNLPLYPH